MKPLNKNDKPSTAEKSKIKISGKITIDGEEYAWTGEVNPVPIEKNGKEYLQDDAEEKMLTEIKKLYRSIPK